MRARRGRSARAGLLRAVEALESRRLFASFVVNGTQLTTTDDSGIVTTGTIANGTILTGSASVADQFVISNLGVSLTIRPRGGGAGDQVYFTAGGGGTLTIDPVSASAGSISLVVASPAPGGNPFPGGAGLNVSTGQISLGTTDRVNFGGVGAVGTVTFAGAVTAGPNTLSFTGTSASERFALDGNTLRFGPASSTTPGLVVNYSNYGALAISGNGGAAAVGTNLETFVVSQTTVPTTITAGTGPASFQVTGATAALGLVAGGGATSVTVDGNSAPLSVSAGSGNLTLRVNGSGGNLTVTGGSATSTNVYTVGGNAASLNITTSPGLNTVVVDGNSGTANLRGSSGTDEFTVNATGGLVAITGGSGTSRFLVAAPPVSPVSVTGGGGNAVGTLTFRGRILPDAFTLGSGFVSAGTGSAVTYSAINLLRVEGGGGTDTFTVSNVSGTAVRIVPGSDASSVFVRSTAVSAPLTVDLTGTTGGAVQVGSAAPSPGSVVTNVLGAVTVLGDADDALVIDNTGAAADATVNLTTGAAGGNVQITGSAAAGVTYNGVATVRVLLGSGNDNVFAAGTPAGSSVTVSGGAGSNRFVAGALTLPPTVGVSSSGALSGIAGTLTFLGNGVDQIALDNGSRPGNAVLDTLAGASSATSSLTGLSSAPIFYAGVSTARLFVGTGATTLRISNTFAGVSTTVLASGTSLGNVTVLSSAGPLRIAGAQAVDVAALSAPLTVASTGNTTLTLGLALDPAAGPRLSNITAGVLLESTGGNTDRVVVSNAGSTAATNGTVTSTGITGVGFGPGGRVAYSNPSSIRLELASASNNLLVASTPTTATLDIFGSATGGPDIIGIVGRGAAINVNLPNTGPGNLVVFGAAPSAAPGTGRLDDLQVAGSVVSVDAPTATIRFDDSAATATRLFVLDTTGLTAGGLFLVLPVRHAAIEVRGGAGDDFVQVRSASVPVRIEPGQGDNTVVLTAYNGAASTNTTPLTLTGTTSNGATNTLIVDASAATERLSFELYADALRINPDSASQYIVSYAGVTSLRATLGSANDTAAVAGTSSPVTLDTADGDDTVTLTGTTTQTLNLTLGTGNDRLVVGFPVTGAGPSGVLGSVLANGGDDGNDVLLIDASAETTPRSVTFTASIISGLNPGGIGYSGFATVDVRTPANLASFVSVASTGATVTANTLTLGSQADVVSVAATGSPLTLITGFGNDRITLGRRLTDLAGPVSIVATGSATLALDDSANPTGNSLTFSAGLVTGPAPFAGLAYSAGVTTLTYTGGTGTDVLTVASASTSQLNLRPGGGTATDRVLLQASPSLQGNVDVAFASPNNTFAVDATSADTSAGVTLGAASLTGVSPGSIAFTGVSSFRLDLPAANDTLTLLATPTGSSLVVLNLGAGTNTVSVPTGNVAPVAAPVQVAGNGSDRLTLDDSAFAGSATVFVSPTALTVRSASFALAGISTVELRLGGSPTTSINDIPGGPAGQLTLTDTGDNSTLNINALSPGARFTLNHPAGSTTVNLAPVAGTVTLTGSGTDALRADDSAASAPRTLTATATTLTGFATGGVTYTGFSAVSVSLGSGDDSLTLSDLSPTTAYTFSTGDGVDTLSLATSRAPGSDAAPLTLRLGAGDDTLTVSSSAGPLSVDAGDGNDTLTVLALGGPGSFDVGNGTDLVSVGAAPSPGAGSSGGPSGGSVAGLLGTLSVGRSVAARPGDFLRLVVDASADTLPRGVVLTSAAINGLGRTISYAQTDALELYLGSGDDRVALVSLGAATALIDTGAGSDLITAFAGLTGDVTTRSGPTPDRLNLDAPTAQARALLSITVTDSQNGISSGFVTGLAPQTGPTGTLTFSGVSAVTVGNATTASGNQGPLPGVPVGNRGASAVQVTGPVDSPLSVVVAPDGTVTFTGSISDTVDIDGPVGLLSVAGLLSGSLTVAGNLARAQLDGGLSGSLAATGTISLARITGRFDGVLIAPTISAVQLVDVAPQTTGGFVFRTLAAGVLRTVSLTADLSTADRSTGPAATGLLVSGYYDATVTPPSVALRLAGAATARADLLLAAPTGQTFNLTRIDAAAVPGNALTLRPLNLRNVAVDGSLINNTTPAQAAWLTSLGLATGAPAATLGGLFLPDERLAAFSVRDVLTAARNILARSLQGVAFATFVGSAPGLTRSAAFIRIDADGFRTTFNLFPLDARRRPRTSIASATEPLLVRAPGNGTRAGLFARPSTSSRFSTYPVLISGVGPGGTSALVSFTAGRRQVASVSFAPGVTGSVEALIPVLRISSPQSLGNVLLRGNRSTVLTLDAPGTPDRIELDGGRIAGETPAQRAQRLRAARLRST